VERIEEAIRKAKNSPRREREARGRRNRDLAPVSVSTHMLGSGLEPLWDVPKVQLDAAHLTRNKIVMHAMTDPSHVAFNILRTRLYQTLNENAWSSVMVTSPSAGCGKTMVSVNLALALARQSDCRTVLIDLDLKKNSVARVLGVKAQKSIGQYLTGDAELEDCFVQVENNLLVGLNHQAIRNFSELSSDQLVVDLLPRVMESLCPKVVIFDFPPVLSGDEVMAYLPQVDCSLLVAQAGETTSREIEDCEAQLSSGANFLGVVLNKCTEDPQDTYNEDDL